jgi:hypothetical protein
VGKRVSAKRERGQAARVAATAPIPPIIDEWLSHLGCQLILSPAAQQKIACNLPAAAGMSGLGRI